MRKLFCILYIFIQDKKIKNLFNIKSNLIIEFRIKILKTIFRKIIIKYKVLI